MSDDRDDHELEVYLQGRSELSRIYGDTRDVQPPTHVNDIVLTAARTRLGSKPLPRRNARRWAVPVSLAAVLVLGVGLVSVMQRQVSEVQELESAVPMSQDRGPGLEKRPAPPMRIMEMETRAQPAIAPGAPNGPAAAVSLDAAEEPMPRATPEQWLEDIERLRREGRSAEAEARLRAFRWRYPDYPLEAPSNTPPTPSFPR